MRETLTPGDIEQSVAAIPPLVRFVREENALPAFDVNLAPDYIQAITQYGKYCMEAYHDPRLADLIFPVGQIENGQLGVAVPPIYESHERIHLAVTESGNRKLLFSIFKPRDNNDSLEAFEQNVTETYGNDDSNPWMFKKIDERFSDGSGFYRYNVASRLFGPMDLMNDTLLYYFVKGTARHFGRAQGRIMKEKVGTTDENKVRERINAFVKANELLAKTFSANS